MANISEFRLLTYKDIKTLLEISSDNTAKKYLEDIKQTTGAPKVLYCHFKKYFKIS
jgi:hypothetical protein